MTTLPEALVDEIERKIAGKVSPDHFYALPLGGPQWTMILAALRSAPVPSAEAVEKAAMALDRARTVLGNMAAENEGTFGAFFGRWPIHHEPLRGDAKRLLPIIDDVLALLTPAGTAPHPAEDDLNPSVATLQRLIATSFDAPTPEVWREALVAAKTVRNHIEGTTPAETAPHPAGGDGIVERLPGWHPTERGLMRRHPRGSWTGRDDAEKTVARKDAEIERLQAQVATARREAIEDAAKVAETRFSGAYPPNYACGQLIARDIRALEENDR